MKNFIPVQKEFSWRECARKETVLVIAPHPDDDVLGAGGTMAAAAAAGREVFSVYLTDGGGSPRIDASLPDDEMARMREQEALAALRILGAAGAFFMRRRSAGLAGEEGGKVEKELQRILLRLRPGEVFLPAPYERHRTHLLSTGLTLNALRAGRIKPWLLGYSLWGCCWGGRERVVREIDAFADIKEKAIMAHASQMAYKDYRQGIMGKNRYEAVFGESHMIQKASFVETFLAMDEFLENRDLSLEEFIRRDMGAFISAYL